MSYMSTVLLTGAGGAALPGLIQRLRRSGYRVLAADMDVYAVGLYLAEAGFVIPPGESPEFLPVLRQICRQHRVDVVVPLVDEELLCALELEREGVTVMLPRREFVATCLDKFQLMQQLQAVEISVPETRLVSTGLGRIEFPILVKPRKGRGSRGLGVLSSEGELLSFLESSPYHHEELLLQTYIEGPEFTVSVVVWRDGEVQAVVPKEIIFKKGITRFAVTRRNVEIEKLCRQLQARLHADGPFNVQLRLDPNTGEPLPFEINPRFSSTVSLTIAAGIDEVGGLIAQAVGQDAKDQFTQWREGVVLLRRTLDEFVEESYFRDRPITRLSAMGGE